MPIQQILPAKNTDEVIILRHKSGIIIEVNENIFQVKIFREPKRKIFSTSLDGAYKILQEIEQNNNYSEDFFYKK